MAELKEPITRQVSPQWDWYMREMEKDQVGFGEARVIFQNGQPVEIIEVLRKKRYNPNLTNL